MNLYCGISNHTPINQSICYLRKSPQKKHIVKVVGIPDSDNTQAWAFLVVCSKKRDGALHPSLGWPRQESNLHLRLRKPTYYPLYYEAQF